MWREFVEFAEKGEESFTSVCARFGVSRKTGYKWLNRFRAEGPAGLVEQSRRPKTSPRKLPDAVAELILGLRRDHPEWSSARIGAELRDHGVSPLPAQSTIDLILRRRRESVAAFASHPDTLRFEPNYRWTLGLGSPVKLAGGVERTPVWVRDDNTRFVLGISLLAESDGGLTVRMFLEQLFRRHGMPWRMALSAPRVHTPLSVWLMRAGLAVDFVEASVSSDESDRRQLAARLASLPSYQRTALQSLMPKADMLQPLYQSRALSEKEADALLERIREQENFRGTTETAAMRSPSPIAQYRPSGRDFPDALLEVSYAPGAEVRLVSEKGIFTFQRRLVHVGRALAGLEVELKATAIADRYVVLFIGQVLGQVDLSVAEIDETTSLPLWEI